MRIVYVIFPQMIRTIHHESLRWEKIQNHFIIMSITSTFNYSQGITSTMNETNAKRMENYMKLASKCFLSTTNFRIPK